MIVTWFKITSLKKQVLELYISAGELHPKTRSIILSGETLIGSEKDSLIAWGIHLEDCQNTIVENNIVTELKVTQVLGILQF